MFKFEDGKLQADKDFVLELDDEYEELIERHSFFTCVMMDFLVNATNLRTYDEGMDKMDEFLAVFHNESAEAQLQRLNELKPCGFTWTRDQTGILVSQVQVIRRRKKKLKTLKSMF